MNTFEAKSLYKIKLMIAKNWKVQNNWVHRTISSIMVVFFISGSCTFLCIYIYVNATCSMYNYVAVLAQLKDKLLSHLS